MHVGEGYEFPVHPFVEVAPVEPYGVAREDYLFRNRRSAKMQLFLRVDLCGGECGGSKCERGE